VALIPYPYNWLAAFAAAALLAALLAGTARVRPRAAVGWAVASVPLWLTLWGILNSLGPLLEGGKVLEPLTRRQLSDIWARKVLVDVGFVGAGALIATASPPWRLAAIAHRLRVAGLPMGGRSEGRSIGVAVLAFPLLALGAYAVNRLLLGVDSLNQGDESSYFDNMTPYHAILLSCAAGFGEEIVYRGVLQQGLLRAMRTRAWGPAVAIALQAVVFGFAHGGYGTWSHVIVPLLFGLLMGWAAQRFGLWCAIALHVLIDIYAFAADAVDTSPWFGELLLTLLGLNVVASVVWLVWRALLLVRQEHGAGA